MLLNLGIQAMIAMARQPGAGQQQGSWFTSLIPIVVIFAIFYFLMIRPQQKQQKKHREMVNSLQKGNRVVTRGGIIGTVYGVADNVITLEVADDIKIKFSREAIANVQNGEANA